MPKIQLSKNFIRSTCKLALNEDLYPSGDITSNLLNNSSISKVKLISNQKGIIGGLEFAIQTFNLLDKNISINICTNKRQHVAEKILKLMNLFDNFDFIVGAKENIPLKPQRQMIDFICNQYDSDENEFIMVGDTKVDILAAKNAEISSVIVDGGYTNEDCKSLGADFYLNNISELKSVLNL